MDDDDGGGGGGASASASALASAAAPLFPDPWFLGLWLADGWFNRCIISVGNAEEGTVGEKLKKYAADINMDVHVQRQNDCNCTRYTIKYRGTPHPGCNALLNALVNLKVAHSGSVRNGYVFVSGAKAQGFYKHIPDKYRTAGEENKLKLLAGFMDGDGCLTSTRDTLVVTQSERVHKELFEDFVKLAISIPGLDVKAYSFNRREGWGKTLRMDITGALNKIQKYMVCSNKIPPPAPPASN